MGSIIVGVTEQRCLDEANHSNTLDAGQGAKYAFIAGPSIGQIRSATRESSFFRVQGPAVALVLRSAKVCFMELRTAGVCSNLVDDDGMMLLMMMPALPHRGVRQSAREAARVDEVRMQLLWDSWCGVERKRGRGCARDPPKYVSGLCAGIVGRGPLASCPRWGA